MRTNAWALRPSKKLIMTKTLYTTLAAALLCGAMGAAGPSFAADYGKDTGTATDKTSAVKNETAGAKDTAGVTHKAVMKHKTSVKHLKVTASHVSAQVEMMERQKTSDLNKAQLMPQDKQAMDMPYAMVASADEVIMTSPADITE